MAKERTIPLVTSPPSPTSLSPTSASTWQQCELRYALTYLYGWKEQATNPQLIGNVVHRAVELLYLAPSHDRSRESASQHLDEAMAEEVPKATYSHLITPDTRDEVRAAGEEAFDGLFALEDPASITVGPEGLEVWVSAELYDAPIRGRIDRLYDADGAQIIADYKTGRVPPPRFTEKAFFGLWTYTAALAAADPHKRLADRVELLYLLGRERLGRPVLRAVALDHAKTLARIWRRIQGLAQVAEVTGRTSRLCDWCAFSDACPARVDTELPPIASPDHDDLLRGLGLQRHSQDTVASTLERAIDPAETGAS